MIMQVKVSLRLAISHCEDMRMISQCSDVCDTYMIVGLVRVFVGSSDHLGVSNRDNNVNCIIISYSKSDSFLCTIQGMFSHAVVSPEKWIERHSHHSGWGQNHLDNLANKMQGAQG